MIKNTILLDFSASKNCNIPLMVCVKPLKQGGCVNFPFFNFFKFMKYCEAPIKKVFTVPTSVNAQRYGLLLYKDLLLRQSNKLLINSIKSAVPI